MGAIDSQAQPEPAYLPLRKVAAVGVGNALAFYDFLTFSFFAIQIGRSFFPARGDPSMSLLFSLATFGVGLPRGRSADGSSAPTPTAPAASPPCSSHSA